MHSTSQLRLDGLELCIHAVTAGLSVSLKVARAGFSAEEREAQEHEGFRFADTAFLAVGRREASELNQARFFRMKRQRELLKPRSHRIKEATSVVLALEGLLARQRLRRTPVANRQIRGGGVL